MSPRVIAGLALLLGLAEWPAASAPNTRQASRFSLEMNYEGAETLLAALEQRTITDAAIDGLLTIRGVAAMVDNTTKFMPSDTRATFRSALKEFVSTRKSTIGHFRLDESFKRSAEIRALIAKLKSDSNLLLEVTRPISAYMPPVPHFTATVYGTTGGVSDGFVPDGETHPALYLALNRAEGDVQGVKLNMTHELFHVVQRMARAGVPGLNAKVFDSVTAPAHFRLLTVILEEGTATYVVESMLPEESFFRRSGPYTSMWRGAYKKNASPKRIVANFAEVDRLISGLRRGSLSWEQASDVVFKGYGRGAYFVGYEMAKAIDRRYGPARLASLLQQHSAEFFRAYIELYRKDPNAVPAKFSKETETYIDSIPAR